MNYLDITPATSKKIELINGYSPKVRLGATFLFGMNKPARNMALEDFSTQSQGLLFDLKRRQENMQFVLKEMKRSLVKMIYIDSVLNRRISKTPYHQLMDIEMLNPMGLRGGLLSYTKTINSATEIGLLTVAKVIPAMKVFLADLIANNSLNNNRPLDTANDIKLNAEAIAELKQTIAKMLDSTYENPVTTYGNQFANNREWEETTKLCENISKNLEDLSKQNVQGDVKQISELIDKLVIKVKRDGEDGNIAKPNVKVVKDLTFHLAEEISFLAATIHLADTLINVMEDNKEFLRDFLN